MTSPTPSSPSASSLLPASSPAEPIRFSRLKILSLDTRAAMDQVAIRETVPAGTTLLTQGERTNDLLILESGQVAGFRTDDRGESWQVLTLGPGDILGEDSFLDAGGQHLTARAETDCALVRISPLDLLALDDGDHYYDTLRASVGITVVQRLRSGTDAHVVTLGRQLEAARTQHQFGQFFLYTLALFSIGMLVNTVISTKMLDLDIYTERFAWEYLLVLLVPSMIIIRVLRIPLRDIGVTTHNLRRSLVDGVLASVAVVALAAGFVWLSNSLEALPDRSVAIDPSGLPRYLAHSFLQELVARGFMLHSFQKFLNDKRGWKSVLVSGVLFGMFHIHFGLAAVIMTYLSCLGFGAFYLRHHNVFGVTLLHFTAGVAAFAIGLI